MRYAQYFFSNRYAPKWLILQIDLAITAFSVGMAYLLRFNFNLSAFSDEQLPAIAALFVLVRLVFFSLTRSYHGILRFTSTQDAKRIFLSVTFGTMFLGALNIGYYLYTGFTNLVPTAVLVIEYAITLVLMSSFRIGVKIIYSEMKRSNTQRENVAIFGAGESGLITKRTLDQDKDSRRKVVAFFDDDFVKKGKTMEGVAIYRLEDNFEKIMRKNRIDEFIISVQKLTRKRKEDIVELCLKHRVKVKVVPPPTDWINGELSAKQIKDVRIEDLLEREPISLDQDQILAQLHEKPVMVTGACGSIGSELVRQIIRYYPSELILIDQAETSLYELQLELKEKYNYINFRTVVADIRNRDKMEQIIATWRPETIYHAAAYKHVPLMEENPAEAVMTNVTGTCNLADLAVEYNVKKFVFISTDKAVNPTNVMGATKRVAEIYVQSLNHKLEQLGGGTRFITTRFGNVLGSNGSVIPRFRKQIEQGGPVTVTHPEICRFFMTIPESCQLILEAGMMGKGGEIYVFDMGEAVKISDLARKMIILSGLVPNKDIQVTYTGLRPGEKIREELLNTKEKTLPTHHPKIMIGKVREYPFDVVSREISDLVDLVPKADDNQLVAKMKAIVPEFVSNNSVFEQLDKLKLVDAIPAQREKKLYE